MTGASIHPRPRPRPRPRSGLLCYAAGMADGRVLLALLPPLRAKIEGLGVDAEDMFHRPGDPLANVQRLCRPGIAAASDGALHLRPFEVRRVRLVLEPLED